jgi:ketosteroid isomerase-like protein
MSRENVELVLSAMSGSHLDMLAMFSGDQPPAGIDVGILAEDVVISFQPRVDDQTFIGLEGLAEGWREWLSAWSSYEAEFEDAVDAGDYVVTFVRLRGETRHDHVVLEQPAAAVFKVENGKVVRLTFHLDRRQALEEAGRPDLLS